MVDSSVVTITFCPLYHGVSFDPSLSSLFFHKDKANIMRILDLVSRHLEIVRVDGYYY